MEAGTFAAVVDRYRGLRTIAAVQLDAGLSESGIRNMDVGQRMPTAQQIQALAAALQAPPDVLTRALLRDRGYDIGEDLAGAAADVGSVARAMTPTGQRMLLAVAEVIRNTIPE